MQILGGGGGGLAVSPFPPPPYDTLANPTWAVVCLPIYAQQCAVYVSLFCPVASEIYIPFILV